MLTEGRTVNGISAITKTCYTITSELAIMAVSHIPTTKIIIKILPPFWLITPLNLLRDEMRAIVKRQLVFNFTRENDSIPVLAT